MSNEYINSRFEEFGLKEDPKLKIILSNSCDGTELGRESIFSHFHYSMKSIEFVRDEITVYLHF